jgi:phenylacetate-CoA ligase
MKWDRMTVAEQRRIQNEKLHRYFTEVIAPFSPYYKRLFGEHKIDLRHIKTVADLRHLPFTSKADLLPTSEEPEKFREFIITPDASVLKHRPRVVAEALFRGKRAVERRFEREYRPIFLTATTGRSSAPVAFTYTDHDMTNLRTTGARLIRLLARPQKCGA